MLIGEFAYFSCTTSAFYDFELIHKRSLQWLRGTNKNVEIELETIRNNIRASKFNMSLANNSSVNEAPPLSLNQNEFPVKQSFKSMVANVKAILKNKRLVRPIMVILIVEIV